MLEGSGSVGFLPGLTFGSRILFEVKESEVLKQVKGLGLGFELRFEVGNLKFWI